MRERLGSGPRIVRALFAAILALGVPIAIALPTDLNGKVYASGAVVLIAAAAAILAAALVRRQGPAADPSDAGRWSLELLRRLEWRRFEELCTAYYEALGFTTTQARSGTDGGADIGLVAGGARLGKTGALAPGQGQALPRLARAGDFPTRTCPACGIKMTARTSSTEGRKFWGCLNYPRCKRTFFGASNAPA